MPNNYYRLLTGLSIGTATTLIGYCAGRQHQRQPISGQRLPASALAAAPPLPAAGGDTDARRIVPFGFPTFDSVRRFDEFVLAYDKRLRLPLWVFERITQEQLMLASSDAEPARFEFYEDLSLHPFFRATNRDFAGSGFDRGHLAAAGNHKSNANARKQTFILANICPQVGKGFNQHIWNSLERYVRSLARRHKVTYVCSGPLFLPVTPVPGSKRQLVSYEVLGSNQVAVPTHFFKIVLLETDGPSFELLSYVIPNMAHPVDPEPSLDAFLVPIEAVERAAGFLIFNELPKHLVTRVNKRKV